MFTKRPHRGRRHMAGGPLHLLFCVLLIAAALTACSDDDNGAGKDKSGAATADKDTEDDTLLGDALSDPDAGADIAPDTPDATTIDCPGGPGCTCTDNSDCDGGFCLNTPAGKQCARKCVTDCPTGFVCKLITTPGGDDDNICVPDRGFLCAPCSDSKQCQALGQPGAACVSYGAAGFFCGSACTTDADCNPTTGAKTADCRDVTTIDGGTAKQCVHLDPTASSAPTPGGCLCSARAAGLKLTTTCKQSITDAQGKTLATCDAERRCEKSGSQPTACEGAKYSIESCDGADNDCDGVTDETNDGLCDDKNECTQNVCANSAGQWACLHPADNGDTCSDGDPCTTGDICEGGKCAGKADKTKCQCNADKDCAAHEDGDLCSGTLYCDTSEFPQLCKVNPGTVPPACAAAKKGGCEVIACEPKTGKCVNKPAADAVACDDGDKCTVTDTCKAGKCAAGTDLCQCHTGADCDKHEDGNLCNGTLYCAKQAFPFKCLVNPATVASCPTAGNTACLKTTCIPTTGKCADKPEKDGTLCDADGSKCTPSDACHNGACVADTTNLCPCTKAADCGKYEDGDQCNGTLFCNAPTGKCELNPATVVSCPTADDTLCRATSCVKLSGACTVTARNVGKACDDDDPCTPDEVCKKAETGGTCHTATNTCACKADKDCAAKEDGDACNGTLFCNLQKGQCELNPATVIKCPSAFDTACERNTCDKKAGQCAMKAIRTGLSCTDGNPCTTGDVCTATVAGGICQPGTATCAKCLGNADCEKQDDGDPCNGTLFCNQLTKSCQLNPATVVSCDKSADKPCLRNTCDKVTGKCAMSPQNQGHPCDDGLPCTALDRCQLGQCRGTAVCDCLADSECDDKNACTVDVCQLDKLSTALDKPKASCVHLPSKATCDDGDFCTISDTCQVGGTWIGAAWSGGTPGDKCHGAPRVCDDGNACTKDPACADNKCPVSVKLVCDDGNACTDDSCDPGSKAAAGMGCVFLANAVTCTDGDACTEKDRCAGGKCVALPIDATACDDGNPCTTDSCDPMANGGEATGCVSVDNKNACEDGNPCTKDDACYQGKCAPGLNHCLCKIKADCSTYDDGDPCTGTWHCASKGAGQTVCEVDATTVVACDASEDWVCAASACDSADGKCAMKPRNPGQACDDGDKCTEKTACSAGKCAGAAVDCTDGDVCTTDACDAKAGCTHVGFFGACNDGNACTSGDKCGVTGKCAGLPLSVTDCDDGNGCTADGCAAASGCTHVALSRWGTCSDGLVCSKGDACKAGACVAEKCPPKVCSVGAVYCDGNEVVECLEEGTKVGVKEVCGGKAPFCVGGKCAAEGCAPNLPMAQRWSGPKLPVNRLAAYHAYYREVWLFADDADDDGRSIARYSDAGALLGSVDFSVGPTGRGPMVCDSVDGRFYATTWGTQAAAISAFVGRTVARKLWTAKLGKAPCYLGLLGGRLIVVGSPHHSWKRLDRDTGQVLTPLPSKGFEAFQPGGCYQGAVLHGTGEYGLIASQHQNLLVAHFQLGPAVTLVSVKSLGVAASNVMFSRGSDICAHVGKNHTCWRAFQSGCTPDVTANCATLDCSTAGTVCNRTPKREGKPCDDNNACTAQGTCAAGYCGTNPRECNDGDGCTSDACDTGKGCTHTPNTAPCDDNNPCTSGDRCKNGQCTDTWPTLCDDANACTIDACLKTKGCTHTPTNDGTPCTDGEVCTPKDTCKTGTCIAGALDPTCADAPCSDGKKRLFASTFGGAKNDELRSIVRVGGGGLVAAGFTDTGGVDKEQGWILGLSDTGAQLWDAKLGGKENDRLHAAVALSGGRIAGIGATGSKGAGKQDGWIVVLNDKHEAATDTAFGGELDDALEGVAALNSGGFAAVGWAEHADGNTTDRDGWLMRVNAAGKQVFATTFGGDELDLFRAVTETSKGELVMVGETKSKGAGGVDAWVVKTTSSGDVLFDYAQGGKLDDRAWALKVRKNGQIFIAGENKSQAKQGSAAWWLELNADGWFVRDAVFDLSAVDAGYAIDDAYGDGFWMAGFSFEKGLGDGRLWRLDRWGRQVAAYNFGGAITDTVRGVAAMPDGGAALAGATLSSGAGGYDGWVVRAGAWGDSDCGKAGVCGGKTAVGCDDGKECTDAGCDGAAGCVQQQLQAVSCDDGDACTGWDACGSQGCAGISKGTAVKVDVPSGVVWGLTSWRNAPVLIGRRSHGKGAAAWAGMVATEGAPRIVHEWSGPAVTGFVSTAHVGEAVGDGLILGGEDRIGGLARCMLITLGAGDKNAWQHSIIGSNKGQGCVVGALAWDSQRGLAAAGQDDGCPWGAAVSPAGKLVFAKTYCQFGKWQIYGGQSTLWRPVNGTTTSDAEMIIGGTVSGSGPNASLISLSPSGDVNWVHKMESSAPFVVVAAASAGLGVHSSNAHYVFDAKLLWTRTRSQTSHSKHRASTRHMGGILSVSDTSVFWRDAAADVEWGRAINFGGNTPRYIAGSLDGSGWVLSSTAANEIALTQIGPWGVLDCDLGKCLVVSPKDCVDDKECTDSTCTPSEGCIHLAAQGRCTSDGDDCTQDFCGAGALCKHSALSQIPCDDNDPCRLPGNCQTGKCLGGAAKDCNDQNDCTVDKCDPKTGCQHFNLPDGLPCGSSGGQCNSGKCST